MAGGMADGMAKWNGTQWPNGWPKGWAEWMAEWMAKWMAKWITKGMPEGMGWMANGNTMGTGPGEAEEVEAHQTAWGETFRGAQSAADTLCGAHR